MERPDPEGASRPVRIQTLLIGELARRAGVTPQTVRYYEREGLLRPPPRSASGYRRYGPRAVEEIAFIKKAQALGFALEEIREVLELGRAGTAPCSRVLALARRHVREIDERIAELAKLKERLRSALARWEETGAPRDCAQTLCGLIGGLDADAPVGFHDQDARAADPAGPQAAGSAGGRGGELVRRRAEDLRGPDRRRQARGQAEIDKVAAVDQLVATRLGRNGR